MQLDFSYHEGAPEWNIPPSLEVNDGIQLSVIRGDAAVYIKQLLDKVTLESWR